MWQCSQCNETNEDNFELCWSCQHDRLAPTRTTDEPQPETSIQTLFMRTHAPVPPGHRVCVRYAVVKEGARNQQHAVHRCRFWPWVDDLTYGITYAPQWALSLRLEMKDRPDKPSALPIFAHGPLPIFDEYYRLDGIVEGLHHVECSDGAPFPLAGQDGDRFTLMRLRVLPKSVHNLERLNVRQAELYLSDTTLEQVWPTGAVHRIDWAIPFECLLHQSPSNSADISTIHMRLSQRSDGEHQVIAITLVLGTTQGMRSLPMLDERHPVIQGPQAERLLNTVRDACALNGVRFAI